MPPTWTTTRWELEFADLLNHLQGNHDFHVDRELDALGWRVEDIFPVDVGSGVY